ncbi:hypothetical protein PAAG_06225 [Paracoccidioides lutzii Pb01]|uniref:Uncharacterized protein n=1 Tax=Paracoccidioides lutzii (strain ATCC MYA-826 / Pb01) TaxID=502779 RepID=C1H5N0_PARBA|nr:hypothetical protein PAAG_06225 [Paracoccidioides lutzii Pb01]EEH35178.2 hypothetical protein PAAG_06225 [Paracoccidioides lutzii Pb01]
MPPDINSLPPPRSAFRSPIQVLTNVNSSGLSPGQSTSPRSPSVSLAAAATMNATDRSRRSSTSMNRSPQANRVHERRRSIVPVNLNLNDPTLPGPGELSSSDHRSSIGSIYRTHSPTSIAGNPIIATGDPHHQRAPSLGEIHQELEQEQEAQVNRLLQMIRLQQQQLQRQQQQHQLSAASGTAIADDSTPPSESYPLMPISLPPSRFSTQFPSNLSRRRSSGHSPALTPHNTDQETGMFADWSTVGGDSNGRRGSRDEASYYQAETAMLTRENQMLRVRIRELERQVAELSSSAAHAPSTGSPLSMSEPVPPTPAVAETAPPPQAQEGTGDVEKS